MLHTKKVAIKDHAGKPIYLLGISEDITERKKIEKELESYRKDLERLVSERTSALVRAEAIAHVGSWQLDLQTNELTWSDETYRIFGIPQGSEVTLDAFMSCIHPDDADKVSEAWNGALTGK